MWKHSCVQSARRSGDRKAWFPSLIWDVEEEEGRRLEKGSSRRVTSGSESSFRPHHRKGSVLGIAHSCIFHIESCASRHCWELSPGSSASEADAFTC